MTCSEVWLGCMPGDEDDARAGCCESCDGTSECLGIRDERSRIFDAWPKLTDFGELSGWFRKVASLTF